MEVSGVRTNKHGARSIGEKKEVGGQRSGKEHGAGSNGERQRSEVQPSLFRAMAWQAVFSPAAGCRTGRFDRKRDFRLRSLI